LFFQCYSPKKPGQACIPRAFGPGYQLLRIFVDNGTSTVTRDIALDGTTGIKPTGKQKETSLKVYPNPGKGLAKLTYQLMQRADVLIRIYAIQGNYSRMLLQEKR
jgi:hypothetical protein